MCICRGGQNAGVAELVYARDSKSRLARDGGSSPLSGTREKPTIVGFSLYKIF